MRSRRTPDTNTVFRLDGGTEDNDLHCRRAAGAWESVWEPTVEERGAISTGANILLAVASDGHPPVLMAVTREAPTTPTRSTPAEAGPVMWLEIGVGVAQDLYTTLTEALNAIHDWYAERDGLEELAADMRYAHLQGLRAGIASNFQAIDRWAEEQGTERVDQAILDDARRRGQ